MADSTFLQACEAAAARFEVPALAVGVLRDGRAEERGFGCDPGTRFRVASVTKPVTASLALQVLDLDEPTGVWPDEVRVSHLLSHTSGYASEIGDLTRFGDGDGALDAAIAELPAARRLAGPGAVWSYANTGYWLTGWLAARATGLSFEDALRREVLEPAGMRATGFEDEPDVPGTGPGASDRYPRARRASGGLVSNVGDLLAFARWQLAHAWTNALRIPLAEPVEGVYGLGFFGEQVGGAWVWGHPGSYGGYQSSLLLVPERGAAFAGLTNSGRGKRALAAIEDAWLESLLGARRTVPETVALDPAAIAAFAGTYADEVTRVVVAPGGAGLELTVVDAEGRRELSARPVGPRAFAVLGGEEDGDRFDFPYAGVARVGSRLLVQTA